MLRVGEEPPLKEQNQKIFSTQQSKNSSGNVQKMAQMPSELDTSEMKLFTFMNCFEQQRTSIPNMKKGNKIRNKNIKQSNKQNRLRRKSSCLKDIIQQSRKKRQNFLNTIIDIDLSDKLARKSKTPKHSMKIDQINLCQKKNKTPKAISSHKGDVKLFRAKSSLRQIQNKQLKQVNNQQIQEKKVSQQLSKKKLLKKKEELQKQLLQINSSLFLKKKKFKNCHIKTKKK